MIYRYFNNGLSFDRQPAGYEALPGEAVFTEAATAEQLSQAFSDYAPSLTAKQSAEVAASVKQRLADLDGFLPRALEDYWTAIGFDTSKLPQVQQKRLTEKQSLRSQLVNVSA